MRAAKPYLDELAAGLGSLDPGVRAEILAEMAGHVADRADALRAAGVEEGTAMTASVERMGEPEEVAAALRDVHERGTWREALAAAMPFLALGCFALFPLLHIAVRAAVRWPLVGVQVPSSVWEWLTGRGPFWLMVGTHVALLAGLGVGWVKEFPRWSMPYVGFALLFTVLWAAAATVGLTVLGHTFGHHERWGWRAWVPLAVCVAACVLVTRSLRPLRRLAAGVWRDWTRVSFAMYGAMPLLTWMLFDEVSQRYAALYLLGASALLTAGAVVYVLSGQTLPRALALLGGMTAASVLTAVGNDLYWVGRLTFFTRGRVPWWFGLRGDVIAWSVVGLVLMAPALLVPARRALERPRTA
jgi:hypothetical protein